MLSEQLVGRIQVAGRFFDKATSCLTEDDSGFAPGDDLYTVAGHIDHTAGSIDWFIDGMFSPKGFDLDFERHIAESKACTSIEAAREHLRRSIQSACETLAAKSDAELTDPLPEDSIFGPVPRASVIDGLVDHTAHHRGALGVYARLIGKTPDMPYG